VSGSLRDSSAHVFVDDLNAPQLEADDEHHLAKVLRLRDGEIVSYSDGAGNWRLGEWSRGGIVAAGEDSAIRHDPLPAYEIAVAFVPVKGDRPEWAVQKLTELGVDHIVPLLPTRRAVVKWSGERLDKQLAKWRRVAREAAMQSRRTRLPVVEDFAMLSDVCVRPGAAVAEPDGGEPGESTRLVIVGPEGGFEPDEVPTDVPRVSLGDTILRAETATLVAATLLGHVRAAAAPRTSSSHVTTGHRHHG
jgi:16S rRNA (uracil1498-N3)-methyltransferase